MPLQKTAYQFNWNKTHRGSICGTYIKLDVLTVNTGFEVLTSAFMKNFTFSDIMPCSPITANRRFGGTWSPPSSGSNEPSEKQA
jgi:hypothetical protein